MARIIHVDDRSEWIDLVQRVLANHKVDSAHSYDEALVMIYGHGPYDLALIDLNLIGEDDRLGGELLDLLRIEFPETRRVVVTASPPPGALRSEVFERYELEEVIIKSKTTLPGLQLAVSRALRRDAEEIPREIKAKQSEIVQEYQSWHDQTEEVFRSCINDIKNKAHAAGRSKGRRPGDPEALNEWLSLEQRFQEECSDLIVMITSARTIAAVESSKEQLTRTLSKFADEIEHMSQSSF
jgi:CheY-like chemotaxis protein